MDWPCSVLLCAHEQLSIHNPASCARCTNDGPDWIACGPRDAPGQGASSPADLPVLSCAVLFSNLRMCQLSAQDAYRFLSTQHCDPQHPPLVGQPQQHLASGPVVAMELMAAQGVRRWLDILGELQNSRVVSSATDIGCTMSLQQHPATPAAQNLLDAKCAWALRPYLSNCT